MVDDIINFCEEDPDYSGWTTVYIKSGKLTSLINEFPASNLENDVSESQGI